MFPTPFRDQLNRLYFPLLAAHSVSDSKISGTNRSSLALKVSWMDVYGEIYERWLWTASNWWLAVVLLGLRKYQKCLATETYLFFCQYYHQWHPEVRVEGYEMQHYSFPLVLTIGSWFPTDYNPTHVEKKLTYLAHSVKSVKVSVRTVAKGRNFQILLAKFLWALRWF
jgi:hypothetical protein